jgi:hypothetical protein
MTTNRVISPVIATSAIAAPRRIPRRLGRFSFAPAGSVPGEGLSLGRGGDFVVVGCGVALCRADCADPLAGLPVT